jgi:hypothetical protein
VTSRTSRSPHSSASPRPRAAASLSASPGECGSVLLPNVGAMYETRNDTRPWTRAPVAAYGSTVVEIVLRGA